MEFRINKIIDITVYTNVESAFLTLINQLISWPGNQKDLVFWILSSNGNKYFIALISQKMDEAMLNKE